MRGIRIIYKSANIAAATAVLSLSSTGYSQTATSNLVPGSADAIHDSAGIAIGMKCDQAVNKLTAQSADHGRFNHQGFTEGARLDGVRITYTDTKYSAPLKMLGRISYDNITFKCLEDGEDRPVFEIYRSIRFIKGKEAAPTIASLRGMFQEKYGVPSVVYDSKTFATLFNKAGIITDTGPECVKYSNGYLYGSNPVFEEFNPDRCSYELTFKANKSPSSPELVGGIEIFIRDHLRLEMAVRAMLNRQKATTPVANPKL